MSQWVTGKIIHVKHWTNRLFSLIVHAPINHFIAGQFTKLRLEIKNENVQRAYSYVNAPWNNDLEFYIVAVKGGKLSTSLQSLQPGDRLIVKKEASGLFIAEEIPSCDNLWMLATGTALGPYLSILEDKKPLQNFNKIILVHAVRFAKDLSYLQKMLELKECYNGKLHIQTIVSREHVVGSLTGRITTLIANGLLEKQIGLQIQYKTSHVMLCGNPKMIRDVQQLLKDSRGMRKHLKNEVGHITSELYW